MGVYTSPAQLMAAQRRRFGLVGQKIEAVHKTLATQGRDHLKELTSGTLTKKDLAGWHPYAKRPLTANRLAMGVAAGKIGLGLKDSGRRQVGRTGRVTPYPINKWTGRVQAGIFLKESGKNQYDIGSTAHHAKYLFAPMGTSKMVPRLIFGERNKHGRDGMIRLIFRAEVHGFLLSVRDYQRSI